ncbi:MAG: aminotransferase class I/II-fold pyridoxal phosphate-dependent enzyme, partial [Candidatus Aenigmarchaeota archaeon]|nr:aminotransferase class I/II-fold pyridoxal phosphate-dependent enzyme [Candidatus Aenigmarchaeota archaeon]
MKKFDVRSEDSVLMLAIEGGEPTRRKPWPTYDKGDIILDENDEIELLAALRSKLLFRYDLRPLSETPVGKFEKVAEDFFGAKHALAVSSGTVAITLALMSLGIKPGDEVALPGFTFAATPSAILLAGAKPILIEVDEKLNLDIDDLKRKYNPRMKALVVVHMRGSASDMKSIMEFADSVGLKVIEDAVPAMGVKFRGKYLGTWGHFGAFSMQSDKSCNTGEGGLLLVNDDLLFARSITLSGAYEGRWKKHFMSHSIDFEDSEYPIYSFRMDNLRGALAYSQMNKLSARLKKMRENYIYVVKELSKLEDIRL